VSVHNILKVGGGADEAVEVLMPRYEDVADIVDRADYERAVRSIANNIEGLAEDEVVKLGVLFVDQKKFIATAVVSALYTSGLLEKKLGDPKLIYYINYEEARKKITDALRELEIELPSEMKVKGFIGVVMKNRTASKVKTKIPFIVKIPKEVVVKVISESLEAGVNIDVSLIRNGIEFPLPPKPSSEDDRKLKLLLGIKNEKVKVKLRGEVPEAEVDISEFLK